MKRIQEGLVTLEIEASDKVSKELAVFYNPAMALNRDIAVLLLNCCNQHFHCAEPLAGSGVRGIRLLKECPNCISMSVNDNNPEALSRIIHNCKLNDITVIRDEYATKDAEKNTLRIFSREANQFLSDSNGYDYIDVDPFGSPGPFLSAAVERLARNGILAVTATDTGALSGTYVKACVRKYWGKPLRNDQKHEIGLRILIRKVQLMGAHINKALVPIYTYSDEHYMRVYFRCVKGKEQADAIMKQHAYFLMNEKTGEIVTHPTNVREGFTWAGPLWVGDLWDTELAQRMKEKCDIPLVHALAQESTFQRVGIYDVHALAKRFKMGSQPRQEELLFAIREKGFSAVPSHLSRTAFRSDMPFEELLALIQQ